jgi:chromosome segregation ATPase
MDTMEDTHTDLPSITPEKLTILKMKHGELGRDFFSEPSSPTGAHRSFNFADGMHSSSVTRRSTGGRAASASRRRSSFIQSHRSEMSKELTSQAEGKFFALMDLMSTASREASSLKESWARIVSEREILLRERDELQLRVDEVTETLERRESEFHHHGHESTERKKYVEKLLLELSVAAAAMKEHQRKVTHKDHELERTRIELRELRHSMTHTQNEHDALKAEIDTILLKLRASEEDRDHAREDSQKHHNELRNLLREHTDLKSKFTDTTTKFESSRKEILTLNDRIKIWELERDEHLHEKDRLQEENRRAKHRAEESSRELTELTERHERSIRDVNKTKEMLRVLEIERDEQSLSLENLRRDLKLKTTGWEEADERCADVTLKYEHLKREVISVKEKLRDVELREIETREASERSREQHRLVVIERDQLKDDLHDEHGKVADGHRRISMLEDSLRRVESTITELRSEIHTLNERNKTLILEKEEGQTRYGHLHTEMNGLKEKILILQAEIRIVSEARDRHRKELDDWKHKYEEVTETITEFRDDSGELEFEIESLRTLLREVREQKERAISARHTADRERDEYIAKYEEKCREMERFEENASAHYHASSKGEGKSSFTRTVSSGTTVHHDKHSHHNSMGGLAHGTSSPVEIPEQL